MHQQGLLHRVMLGVRVSGFRGWGQARGSCAHTLADAAARLSASLPGMAPPQGGSLLLGCCHLALKLHRGFTAAAGPLLSSLHLLGSFLHSHKTYLLYLPYLLGSTVRR